MKPGDYPPQEPPSPLGARYAAELARRAEGVVAPAEDHAWGDDPYQSVALWPAPRPGAPVLLFLHGGGWTSGYKEWMAFMAPAVLGAGAGFAVGGYRLAPAHRFPDMLADVRGAVAAVRRLAPGVGADPARLFVGGHSAGGHLAACVAGDEGIAGCLPLSGVFRFGAGSGLTQRPRFLRDGEEGEREASPVLRPPAQVPMLLAWGSNDFPHLIPQAEEMVAAQRGAGGVAGTLVLEGCDHFQASLAAGDADGPWVRRAAAFMGLG